MVPDGALGEPLAVVYLRLITIFRSVDPEHFAYLRLILTRICSSHRSLGGALRLFRFPKWGCRPGTASA